jgi:hypothetical protein
MNNSKNTVEFLNRISSKTRAMILKNIADHYGITPQQAFDEVTDEEAEHLLDYVTGPPRDAVSLFMHNAGLRGF